MQPVKTCFFFDTDLESKNKIDLELSVPRLPRTDGEPDLGCWSWLWLHNPNLMLITDRNRLWRITYPLVLTCRGLPWRHNRYLSTTTRHSTVSLPLDVYLSVCCTPVAVVCTSVTPCHGCYVTSCSTRPRFHFSSCVPIVPGFCIFFLLYGCRLLSDA